MTSGGPTVIFAGPTIESAAIIDRLGRDAIVLGPARQGDVMRASRLGARVIAIIDGYFQSVPAVWHKEILWAMVNGAHVLGAASMGALRAAELHTFGMVGVGEIFAWFRDGVLIRDDEVAVAHAPAAHGYRNLSEAMVNIRATVRAARTAGVLAEEEAATVLSAAAQRFYPDRHWPGLLDAVEAAHGRTTCGRLSDYLGGGGRVDQKRADAEALVSAIAGGAERWSCPPAPGYTLAHTIWFDHLHASSGQFAASGEPTPAPRSTRNDIEDELRLRRHYRPALRASLVRSLATDEARRRRVEVEPEEIARYANAVCADLGLTDQASFDAWLDANGLDLAAFNALMERELRRNVVLAELSLPAQQELPDALRLAGLWPAVAARAARKVELLEEAGLADPSLADTGLNSVEELVTWWLARIGKPGAAAGRDIATLARMADFADRGSFVQALLREHCAERLGLGPLDDEGNWW